MNLSTLAGFIYVLFVVSLILRIIMQKRPVSTSLAWILILTFLPIIGVVLYLLIGEEHIAPTNANMHDRRYQILTHYLTKLSEDSPDVFTSLNGASLAMARFLKQVKNSPPLLGNTLEIFDDSLEVLEDMTEKVKNAKESCYLLFYIYANGGYVDELSLALMDAAKRGLDVRLMVDAVGSSSFLKSSICTEMRAAGVKVQAALEVGFIRMWFRRIDVRNHRKIFIIDQKLAYTGSQNIADPRYFKAKSKVGRWVDAVVRVQGPIVQALTLVFFSDWCSETTEDIDGYFPKIKAARSSNEDAIAQIAASGPGIRGNIIHELLISAIYAAREEIVITTPYFVPSDEFVHAIRTAALSGVRVTIVVPENSDFPLVKLASRAIFSELLSHGVIIQNFHGGLLHSKTITVDGSIALIGSVNMDMRSFYINFEISLFCYDEDFTRRLRLLQASYYSNSTQLSADEFIKTSFVMRLRDGLVRLISPLL